MSKNIHNGGVLSKLESPADLSILKKNLRQTIKGNDQGSATEHQVLVRIAMATCGIASGAREVMDFMTTAMKKRGIDARVMQTGCMGYCYAEPTLEITLPGHEPVVFGYVDLNIADLIIEKYIKNNELVDGVIPVNYRKIDK